MSASALEPEKWLARWRSLASAHRPAAVRPARASRLASKRASGRAGGPPSSPGVRLSERRARQQLKRQRASGCCLLPAACRRRPAVARAPPPLACKRSFGPTQRRAASAAFRSRIPADWLAGWLAGWQPEASRAEPRFAGSGNQLSIDLNLFKATPILNTFGAPKEARGLGRRAEQSVRPACEPLPGFSGRRSLEASERARDRERLACRVYEK